MDMNIYINIYLHGVSHFLGCGEIVDLNECPIWDHSQNVCHDHDFMLGVIVPAFLEVVHLVLLLFCQCLAIGIGGGGIRGGMQSPSRCHPAPWVVEWVAIVWLFQVIQFVPL